MLLLLLLPLKGRKPTTTDPWQGLVRRAAEVRAALPRQVPGPFGRHFDEACVSRVVTIPTGLSKSRN
jgi:hypothetical protein